MCRESLPRVPNLLLQAQQTLSESSEKAGCLRGYRGDDSLASNIRGHQHLTTVLRHLLPILSDLHESTRNSLDRSLPESLHLSTSTPKRNQSPEKVMTSLRIYMFAIQSGTRADLSSTGTDSTQKSGCFLAIVEHPPILKAYRRK